MSGDFRSFALPMQDDVTETVHQNLAELDRRLRPLHAARAFHLGELIFEISPEIPLDYEAMLERCERLFPERSTDPYLCAQHYADLLSICCEIANAYPQGYEHIFSHLFGQYQAPSAQAQGRVAYVANHYTEQAFMELTVFIKQRRVAYFHHFDDVCQEVNNGLCEYGILPIESTSAGLMAGLFRQIELYSLQICATCRVTSADQGYTTFALVRKALPPMQPEQQHCLDFLCTPTDASDISELIAIAGLCSHQVLHAATYAGRESETFRLRLGICSQRLYPFLLYLLLFCADITPIGFYLNK
ncbi:MAG: hypothetical protein E7581_06235 [Ruminococcaceae bacterium]|nr:hypothetical protein [Oscillospiraceae bacterium]